MKFRSLLSFSFGLLLMLNTASIAQAAVSQFNDGIAVGGATLSPGLAVDVNGSVGATNYCDKDGNNCTLAAALAGKWLDGGGANEIYYNAANVGIGITNPSNKLHVYHATANTLGLFESGDATAQLALADTTGSVFIQTAATGELRLATGGTASTAGTNATTKLTIEANGEVGIGTANPTEELYVTKSQTGPTTIVAQNTSTSTNTNTRAGFAAAANGGQLDIMHYGAGATGSLGGSTKADAAYIRTASGSPSSKMVIGNGGAVPLHLITSDLARMTVLGNGDVGIGTTAPGYKLDVFGNARIGGNATGTDLLIEATNTAGAPATTTSLTLRGYEDRGKGMFMIDTANTKEWFVGKGYDYSGIGLGYSASGGQAEYATNAKLMVNTNGNVGIGTSSPDSKLHMISEEIATGSNKGFRISNYDQTKEYSLRTGVTGVNNTSFSLYDETAGVDRLLVTTAGNVGIGTTAPAQKLAVVGNVDISGNLNVGAQASQSSSETADISQNFTGDGNYSQIISTSTVSGTVTTNRTGYGGNFILTNNRAGTANGSRGYGYGVRSLVQNSGSLAKSYYNAGGYFDSRNNSTNGVSNLRGVFGQVYQNATSGTTDNAYGVEGFTRGRSSAGATSVISNARGVQGTVYPYNSNITNGYGVYGYAGTNNSYSGNMTTAYGVKGTVNHDSDDGGTMTTAYGGYFNTYKRSTAPNIGTAYGVYASAAGGATNYGVYSAAGTNHFNGAIEFNGDLKRVSGSLLCPVGEVMLGFDDGTDGNGGLVCDIPPVNYQ